MSRLSLAAIQRLLRSDGLEGASSPTSDPNDPRHRRNAQAATHALQQHNPDQFGVVDKVLNLNIRRPLDTRIVDLDFVGRWAPDETTNPVKSENGFFSGASFILSTDDQISGIPFCIPDDMDRTRDATLHVRWYRRGSGVASGTTCGWSIPVLAWTFGDAINLSATLTLSLADAILPTASQETGVALKLNAATLFASTVDKIKFNIIRVTSSDEATDNFANAPVLHTFAVEYHVKHDHRHERTD